MIYVLERLLVWIWNQVEKFVYEDSDVVDDSNFDENESDNESSCVDMETVDVVQLETEIEPGPDSLIQLLPESDWKRIKGLKERWCSENKRKSTLLMRSHVREALVSSLDPYAFCLHLLKTTYRHGQGPQSLARVALTELHQWIQGMTGSDVPFPKTFHKETAVQVGAYCNPILFQFIHLVYDLGCEPKALYEPCIWKLIEKNMFKEAASCVSVLHMYANFTVNDILLPLLFYNKPSLVERYLEEGGQKTREAFLKLLDTLCCDGVNLDVVCKSANVERTTVTKKQLQKLSDKLVKQYSLYDVERPNSALTKATSAMNSYLYLKYKKQSDGKWDELLECCVAQFPSLQMQAVDAMISNGDVPAAVRFARKFNIPSPHLLAAMERQGDHTRSEIRRYSESLVTGISRAHQKYYALPIQFESIHFVDDLPKLQGCMKTISKPGTMVGVDAEWRPTPSAKLGLLQLAVADEVYLLDMVKLPAVIPNAMMTELIRQLFASSETLTLGYAISSDIEILAATCSYAKSVLCDMKRVVDLWRFDQSLKEKEEQGPRPESEHRGLSGLVQVCLGLPLDKNEQMSDWERRPLRRSQIIYAALDAHCLLGVYEVLCAKARRLSFELREEINLEPSINPVKGVKKKGAVVPNVPEDYQQLLQISKTSSSGWYCNASA